MVLTKIFDRIMDLKGDFEVLEFQIGKRKTDYSYARLVVKGRDEEHLNHMLREMYRLGATARKISEVKLAAAPDDMILPDNFYATTNHVTSVFLKGRWLKVEAPMMDKVIIVDPIGERAYCKPIRQVKKGELVVIGELGIRIKPPERPREGIGVFGFMTSQASSEKPSAFSIRQIAKDIHTAKKEGHKIIIVAGPAVVHTGASSSLAKIIRLGYVNALLTGNALAVHDVEYALYGTSLGVNIENPLATSRETRNHLMAINEVLKAGSLRKLVESGVLKKGIFYECIVEDIPFILAGSVRDDGPIPDVITDSVKAQRMYHKMVKDADMVIMLATMLHSIAVGNLLPSTIKVICIDINPVVITKLVDRGTAQALGVISDVGVFLPLLVEELNALVNDDVKKPNGSELNLS